MNFKILSLVFVFGIFLALIFFNLKNFTGFFVYRYVEDKWWNSSYHFRIKIEIDSSDYNRTNWPVEIFLNLTQKLQEVNISGKIDLNSLRLIEYDFNGNPLRIVPFQFDVNENFDAYNNAVGELVFILNGTNNAKRKFYLYFDIEENGKKESINFLTNLSYSINGNFIYINTSGFAFTLYNSSNKFGFINIQRLTDGLYVFYPSDEPFEYTITYNQSSIFYYIPYEIQIIEGPIRLGVKVKMREFDGIRFTGINYTKIYYFYNYAGPGSIDSISSNLLKIKQKFEGNAIRFSNFSFGFNVTNLYGDPAETIGFEVNTQNPYSYAYAFRGSFSVQIINLNYSNIEFFANSDLNSNVGIYFNENNINNAEQTSSIFVGILSTPEEQKYPLYILNSFTNPINITIFNTENREVLVGVKTDFPVYNRGEKVFITAFNISDPYDLISNVTAIIDRGTLDASDDMLVILYDDGLHNDNLSKDKIFANSFSINATDNIGKWKITIYVYDKYGTLLITNQTEFNVTNILNVETNIINKHGYVNRIINATLTVKNFRNDTYITNASIICYDDGIAKQTNVTNFNNGSYLISIQASSLAGYHILNCSATYFNNTGFDEDIYDSTDVVTYLDLNITPNYYFAKNITFYNNESFTFIVNVSNLHIGYAYDVNITFEKPIEIEIIPNKEYCNTIYIDGFCTKQFTATIKNASLPKIYNVKVNVSWRNYDGTLNSTSKNLTIEVKSNKILDIQPNSIFSINPPGKNTFVGKIVLNSSGNDYVYNISFYSNLTDFNFIFYPNISQIDPGKVIEVNVNVSIPLGYPAGTYYGIINVSSEIGYKEIPITLKVSGTYTTLEVFPNYYFAKNITFYNNESFEVLINATNIGSVEAFFSFIQIHLPSNFVANQTFKDCGNLTAKNSCILSAKITIKNATLPGVYRIFYSFNWTDIGIGNNSIVNETIVEIKSNKILSIEPNNISAIVEHNKTFFVGKIVLNSSGNDYVYNISFYSNLTDFNFIFYPNISQIDPGKVIEVNVNVSIPLGYPAGTYYGIINVSSEIGYKEIFLNLTVIEDRRWNIDKDYCEATFYPPSGIVCNVSIFNLGNMPISFNITPNQTNYTWININNFVLNAQNSTNITIYYDVTYAPLIFIYAFYNVSALEDNAIPRYRIINVTLKPFVGAIGNLSIIPNITHQSSNITFNVSVFDRSGIGMDYVIARIKKPDNIEEIINFTKIYEANRTSIWIANFTNTTLSGIYFVTLEMKDKANITTYTYGNFSIYKLLFANVFTNKPEYKREETASIYFTLNDFANLGVDNASVTIEVLTPNNFKIYKNSFITENGKIPIITINLPSDAEIGKYVINAFVEYFDPIKNGYTYTNATKEFYVKEKLEISLFADLETSIVWYPENVMKFAITFYDSYGNLFDPDFATLNVYDPAENLYFSKNISDFRRESQGFYTFKYAMPPNTPTGAYLAVLNFSKSNVSSIKTKMFRVSAGGPFDIKVNLLKKEVARGELLPFEITIINMGETSMDVFIEYFISDAQGNTYYYSSEWIYSPAGTNKTILREAYIFSNQPLGLHYLNVIMTYDTIKPPLGANETFYVIEAKPQPIPSPAAPPAAPPVTPVEKPAEIIKNYSIEFLYIPSEIRVVAGEEKAFLIVIKNVGNRPLTNIEVKLLGIDESWYRIKNSSIKVFNPNDTLIFEIYLTIPSKVKPQEISTAFYFKSFELITSRDIKLKIFQSLEDLLLDELKELKDKLLDLKSKTIDAKLANKNVTEVEKIISQAEELAKQIEDLIKQKQYDDATKRLYELRSLIDKGFYLLQTATPIIRFEWEKILIIIAVIVLISIAAFIITMYIISIRRVRKSLSKVIEASLKEISKIKEAKQPEERKPEIDTERYKKMLEVLEREYREGIISKEMYEELKKRIEEKLK